MLSILIPVFNFDVANLVHSLHRQCVLANVEFEIILADDASLEYFREKNKKLNSLTGVHYYEESINLGRSKIRNKLANLSRYPYLLFMDCDSQVASNDYISVYLKHCTEDVVICGGRIYEAEKPADYTLLLRWKHGRLREVFSAEWRNKYPNRSFMTNNFLISKILFDKILFHEGINGYGHEDTLFGFDLKKMNIKILHIDNPLVHIGLEESSFFLEKTKEGIKNLKYISGINNHESILIEDIKLLYYFRFFERLRLKKFLCFLFNNQKKSLEKNLNGRNPNMFFFDLYKLGYMCSIE
jgi:glycosyltransferase involved in cell wall biosynthesis